MEDHRLFVVGDIHGCHDKLTKMLDRLGWEPGSGDQLIFLGDYIDRGPQSYEVVETVSRLLRQYPGEVVALMGNHERMFLDFISGLAPPQLFANGQAATVGDYSRPEAALTAEHLLFYRNLSLYHETEDYIFVHAGMAPGKTLAEQDPQDLLWIREPFLESDHDFGKIVVFGHTPFEKPLVAPGRLGLDTGAVYGGPLTAVVLPEMKFIFAE